MLLTGVPSGTWTAVSYLAPLHRVPLPAYSITAWSKPRVLPAEPKVMHPQSPAAGGTMAEVNVTGAASVPSTTNVESKGNRLTRPVVVPGRELCSGGGPGGQPAIG